MAGEAFTYVSASGGREAATRIADELRNAGATVVGAWSGAGSIGWWDDEVAVMAAWPGDHGDVEGIQLRATARPTSVAPLAGGGVFAHRWFEIDAGDWEEVLELSTGAWPAFERSYGATIEGFFRSEDRCLVLLLTRYPDVATWERSRGVLRERGEDAQDAGRRFLRRRELTKRSIVRVGWLHVLS